MKGINKKLIEGIFKGQLVSKVEISDSTLTFTIKRDLYNYPNITINDISYSYLKSVFVSGEFNIIYTKVGGKDLTTVWIENKKIKANINGLNNKSICGKIKYYTGELLHRMWLRDQREIERKKLENLPVKKIVKHKTKLELLPS